MRTLILVLGDQLSHTSPALLGLDPDHDAVLMIEAPGEATHVWSHKARIAIFLAAMRHFRDELRRKQVPLHYVELVAEGEPGGLLERLASALARLRPERLKLVEAGEWRLQQGIEGVARAAGVDLQTVDDTHFLCSRADFRRWAGTGRRTLRMEFFYREMRREHRVLLDAAGKPEGGRWNFDAENRKRWPKSGPGLIPPPEGFAPDATTGDVLALVESRFAEHQGSLDTFLWPVCREDALRALAVFVETRLPMFGTYQDAMWTATPLGWHALLSSSLNLHLLDPREVIVAAEAAYRAGRAPLASVEGYIRQILGWREFIHGVYWLDMPGLAQANHLQAHRKLPAWFWTGATKMVCAREAIGSTLRHGYAHHIHRLMVTGLFAMLAEIEPGQVADWYLAVYVDAVEWVELPNVVGMALYAHGDRFTSKPYIASGAYIDRMSNYCGGCAYAPTPAEASKRTKPLCPYTVLYWNFVDRHADALRQNVRAGAMVTNLERRSSEERESLRSAAAAMLERLDAL